MKKIINKVFAILVLFLFTLAPVLAATTSEVQEGVVITDPVIVEDAEQEIEEIAGRIKVMPGSAWYGFKVFGENIKLAFRFRAEDKLKVREEIAKERLAEMYRLMNEGNETQLMNQVMNRYNRQIQAMYKRMEGIGNESKIVQRLQKKLQIREQVLQKVIDKVPEQAKPAIMHAIQIQKEQKERLIEKFQNKTIGKQNQNIVKTQVKEKIQKYKPGTGLVNDDNETEVETEEAKEIVDEAMSKGIGKSG